MRKALGGVSEEGELGRVSEEGGSGSQAIFHSMF